MSSLPSNPASDSSEIYFGFSAPAKWKVGAALIRLFLRLAHGRAVPYSHVFIFWRLPFAGLDEVFEANHQVRFRGPNDFVKTAKLFNCYRIIVPPDVHARIMRRAKLLQGSPYAWGENLGLFLIYLAGILGWKLKNPWLDGEASIKCSELAAMVVNWIADELTPFDVEFLDHLDNIDPYEMEKLLGELSIRFPDIVQHAPDRHPSW